MVVSFSAMAYADWSTVVNVPGTTNPSVNPVTIQLDAGTYTVTIVEPPYPGAIYTAYSFYSYGGLWSTNLTITLAASPYTQLFINPDGIWSDPNTAFQNSQSGSFTITTSELVNLGVADSYYGDNTGGVSVLLDGNPTSTPIPAAAYLLGSGLLGLVAVRKKMQK